MTTAKPPGDDTQREIDAYASAWAAARTAVAALSTADRNRFWVTPHDHLLYTGCGSAYFAGMSLAAIAQAAFGGHGIHAIALPASEVLFASDVHVHAGMRPLLIALSRSGETSETIAAVTAFRTQFPGQPAALITCTADSLLARMALPGDLLIHLPIIEHSVVQTSSLGAMLLAGLYLIAADPTAHLDDFPSGDAVETAERLIAEHSPLLDQLGADAAIDRFFFLGGGIWRGIASEAMLKLKEMTFCQSEAFHPLELRHGLGANAGRTALITAFLSFETAAATAEAAVVQEFRQRGAHTLMFVPAGVALPPADDDRDHRITLGQWGVETVVTPLPLIQRMGLTRALHVGRDPDLPEHLTSFIRLEPSTLPNSRSG